MPRKFGPRKLRKGLRVGEAVVRVLEQVARRAATTYGPGTGLRDLDTLRLLGACRRVRAGKALDSGVYGQVVTPGRVALSVRLKVL